MKLQLFYWLFFSFLSTTAEGKGSTLQINDKKIEFLELAITKSCLQYFRKLDNMKIVHEFYSIKIVHEFEINGKQELKMDD